LLPTTWPITIKANFLTSRRLSLESRRNGILSYYGGKLTMASFLNTLQSMLERRIIDNKAGQHSFGLLHLPL